MGRAKIHDTCDVSWKSGEQSGTEQSVSLSVCMSHAAALERLKYREKRQQSRGGSATIKNSIIQEGEGNERHKEAQHQEPGHL